MCQIKSVLVISMFQAFSGPITSQNAITYAIKLCKNTYWHIITRWPKLAPFADTHTQDSQLLSSVNPSLEIRCAPKPRLGRHDHLLAYIFIDSRTDSYKYSSFVCTIPMWDGLSATTPTPMLHTFQRRTLAQLRSQFQPICCNSLSHHVCRDSISALSLTHA